MPFSTHAVHLQHQIDTQLELAALAPCDAIRAMHQDLEKLYRARLVAVIMRQRLTPPMPPRLPDAGQASQRAASRWSAPLHVPNSVSIAV